MSHSRAQGTTRADAFWRLSGRNHRLPIDPDPSPDDPAEPSHGHQPVTKAVHRRDPRVLTAIGAGGFIGTIGRYGIALNWPVPTGMFPVATFVINTSGAFLIGLTLTWILERLAPSKYLQPFLCVGVLGAWTTMSTLATEADVLLKDGAAGQALTYLVGTLVAGTLATTAGMTLGRLGAKRS